VVAEGVSTPQVVDQLFESVMGSLGPFRRMDKVGLDVVLDIEEHYAATGAVQPLDEQLVQPVGRIQRDPVAGAVYLLVATGSFQETTRHLHAFAVKVVIVGG
jgi:3-hydroxyacyl-CoA dehydrogenase